MMTSPGEIQTLQGAPGGTLELRVVRGADERTVHVVITPDIEGQ